MPLNNSGPISIGGSTTGQSINLELGRAGTAQSSLNESALRTLAGVPSGAISMSNFYGKSNETIVINNESAFSDDTYNPPFVTTVSASITLFNTGNYRIDVNTGSGSLIAWLSPTSAASNYEALATIISSGAGSWSGTFGSWLDLATTRSWTHNYSPGGAGSTTGQISVQIRRKTTFSPSKTISFSTTLNMN